MQSADADGPVVTLKFSLQLRRQGPQARWTAQLSNHVTGPGLHFGSLPEFFAYLARLDDTAPERGLR